MKHRSTKHKELHMLPSGINLGYNNKTDNEQTSFHNGSNLAIDSDILPGHFGMKKKSNKNILT